MAFLTINGISLPVARGSFQGSIEEVGERGRTAMGSAFSTVRARKRVMSLQTPPLARSDTDAWMALLNGLHCTWDFEADLWSWQGHAPTATAGAAQSTSAHKFGSGSLAISGSALQSCAWTHESMPAWTVAVWRRSSAQWWHHVECSDGTRYLYGVASQSGAPEWLTSSETSLSLIGIDSSAAEYDDLLLLPAVVPASWPAQMYALNASILPAPYVLVGGDAIGATAIWCQGQAVESEPIEVNGATETRFRLSITLTEG